ncbi:TPA: hypothetical protein ACUJOI_002241, partial [Streptococcus agalactiae]
KLKPLENFAILVVASNLKISWKIDCFSIIVFRIGSLVSNKNDLQRSYLKDGINIFREVL